MLAGQDEREGCVIVDPRDGGKFVEQPSEPKCRGSRGDQHSVRGFQCRYRGSIAPRGEQWASGQMSNRPFLFDACADVNDNDVKRLPGDAPDGAQRRLAQIWPAFRPGDAAKDEKPVRQLSGCRKERPPVEGAVLRLPARDDEAARVGIHRNLRDHRGRIRIGVGKAHLMTLLRE